MTANTLFYILIAILIISFIIDKILDALNAKHFNDTLPIEVKDVYDDAEYKKSQRYKATNYKFGLLTSTFSLILTLGFFFFDGFAYVDQIARQLTTHSILITLIFFGIIMLGSDVITTPFSYYKTFVIEEQFGFNKTTRKTFILDKIKGWFMTIFVGGLILGALTWFYQTTGSTFWIYA